MYIFHFWGQIDITKGLSPACPLSFLFLQSCGNYGYVCKSLAHLPDFISILIFCIAWQIWNRVGQAQGVAVYWKESIFVVVCGRGVTSRKGRPPPCSRNDSLTENCGERTPCVHNALKTHIIIYMGPFEVHTRFRFGGSRGKVGHWKTPLWCCIGLATTKGDIKICFYWWFSRSCLAGWPQHLYTLPSVGYYSISET